MLDDRFDNIKRKPEVSLKPNMSEILPCQIEVLDGSIVSVDVGVRLNQKCDI